MPSPRKFLEAFDLHKGTVLAPGVIVTRVSISHQVLQRYRKYAFPMVITVSSKNRDDTSQFIADLFHAHVGGHRVVNSDFGNPYDCYIDSCSRITRQLALDGRTVLFELECTGMGDRVFAKR